jgi:hypothetical protein
MSGITNDYQNRALQDAHASLDWIKRNVAGAANLDFGDDPTKWNDILKKAGITLGPNAQACFDRAIGNFVSARTATTEALESLEAMKRVLDSGDIEGAVMLLQTTRAKSLESQLGTEIKAMQARNAQIKLLNEKLNAKQEEFSKMDPENKDQRDLRAQRQKAISDLKTEIDGLNSESQINMIRVQGLVNKRNEAFDMLSNLIGKFQKTIDGIVGNMR